MNPRWTEPESQRLRMEALFPNADAPDEVVRHEQPVRVEFVDKVKMVSRIGREIYTWARIIAWVFGLLHR